MNGQVSTRDRILEGISKILDKNTQNYIPGFNAKIPGNWGIVVGIQQWNQAFSGNKRENFKN